MHMEDPEEPDYNRMSEAEAKEAEEDFEFHVKLQFWHLPEHCGRMWTRIEEIVVQQGEQNTPAESQDTNLNANVPLSSKGSKEKKSGTKRKSASIVLPYAQRYGGHLFGSWAGQLGDGLAVLQSMKGGGIVVLLKQVKCLREAIEFPEIQPKAEEVDTETDVDHEPQASDQEGSGDGEEDVEEGKEACYGEDP
ncbi:hypothetical protein GIB67_027987 [Kingdonia uniflora]|uniref:Selenoprotein O n=1 Tax=Kingdonia uniflora TaxID=39325 RepID=A0A7J7L2J5_9MAGN|nr:hypothetical protein GIB67_027987 [Kingdonia uniflora]